MPFNQLMSGGGMRGMFGPRQRNRGFGGMGGGMAQDLQPMPGPGTGGAEPYFTPTDNAGMLPPGGPDPYPRMPMSGMGMMGGAQPQQANIDALGTFSGGGYDPWAATRQAPQGQSMGGAWGDTGNFGAPGGGMPQDPWSSGEISNPMMPNKPSTSPIAMGYDDRAPMQPPMQNNMLGRNGGGLSSMFRYGGRR